MENSRNEQFVSLKLPAILSNMVTSHTVLLCSVWGPQLSTSSWPRDPGSGRCVVLLLTYHQKVSSILTPSQYPNRSSHFISSCGLFIISHHPKKKGEYRKISYFERQKGPIHITFITVYCYTCSMLLLVVVVNLSLCLIYEFNLSKVCM